MRLTTKKIIAREFLALLLVLLFGMIIFLCIYPYNAFVENKINGISNEINSKSKEIDRLSYKYKSKLDYKNLLYENWNNTELEKYPKEVFLKRLDNLEKHDSIDYKWKNTWDSSVVLFFKNTGFKNPYELKVFIKNNRLTENENFNFKKANKLKSVISKLNKEKEEAIKNKFSDSEQMNFTLYSILLISIFTFVIRYLFYGVKWSFKTLKEKV